MARFILEGLTKKQAEAMASYYEGQGEQDCEIWLEDRGCKAPLVDVQKQPWKRWEGEDLILTTK